MEVLREIDGRLVVPDTDPRDPWDASNVYVLDKTGWYKHRSLKAAIHTFDVLPWQGELVAATGAVDREDLPSRARLFRSSNFGASWVPLPLPDETAGRLFRFVRMADFGDRLFVSIEDPRQGFWTLDKNWSLAEQTINLFPDFPNPSQTKAHFHVGRAVGFRGDVLYTRDLRFYPMGIRRSVDGVEYTVATDLYRLDQGGRVSQIKLPRGLIVRDIEVIADQAYVLGTKPDGDRFHTEILASKDLSSWTEVASVYTAAAPRSFARLAREWFIGLGSNGDKEINPASGAILHLRSRRL